MAEDKKRRPSLESIMRRLTEDAAAINIADRMEEAELDKLAGEVVRDYEVDEDSRSEWKERSEKMMDVALQVRQAKNYPFENAANIKYPLVTVAALQFGARAYPAIVDGPNIVKGKVLGNDQGVPVTGPDGQPVVDPQTGEPQWINPPGVKRQRADRIGQHMSYQLLYEMPGWEADTDTLLHHIPIIGCAFRKVYRDGTEEKNRAEMVQAVDLVVNNKVRSIEDAPRITHLVQLFPHQIEERKLSGEFLDIELLSPTNAENDQEAPHTFLEQHRRVDMDGDGYREPYVVTVHKDSGKCVRVVANFDVQDIRNDGKKITRIEAGQYFVKYGFIPDPKGGFYDLGFGHLLESLGETIDTTINQMLDAGHLQNAGGGFIGSGVRLKRGEVRLSPGRYMNVDAPGSVLRDAIVNIEHPGPSPVLFQLLGMIIEAARDITAVKDIMTGDTGDRGVQTATATLALIEQGLKVFTAIYKRVYRSLTQELKLLFKLNSRYLEDKVYFTLLDEQQAIAKEDYDLQSVDVLPVADPRLVTDMQRSARANVLMQIAMHPTLGPLQNPMEVLKRVYESTGIENPQALIVPPQQPDPIMMAAADAEVKGKQAKAAKDAAEADKKIAETELMQRGAQRDDIKVISDISSARMKQDMDLRRLMNEELGEEDERNNEVRRLRMEEDRMEREQLG